MSQICFTLIPTTRKINTKLQSLKIDEILVAAFELKTANINFQKQIIDANIKSGHIASIAGGVDLFKVTLDDAHDNLIKANEKIKIAIENLNKQGLSGAFSYAADNAERERKLFLFIFLVAIISLVTFASNQATLFDEIGRNYKFMGGLTIVAPLVWLGWFSVKQIGQSTIIRQDYGYKTAVALAFEAHKKEIADADLADKELSNRFLEIVVRNFGDNPVRLLSSTKDNKGHPAEEIISKFSDGKIMD